LYILGDRRAHSLTGLIAANISNVDADVGIICKQHKFCINCKFT